MDFSFHQLRIPQPNHPAVGHDFSVALPDLVLDALQGQGFLFLFHVNLVQSLVVQVHQPANSCTPRKALRLE